MGLDGLTLARPTVAATTTRRYAITDDGRAVWTEGMERYLVRED